MLRARCRRAINSEDDIVREVISDTARPDADALAAQILEVAYAGIGASDDGKCFPVKCDQGAQLWIGASSRERSLTMKSGIGDVGLRKAKICIAALDTPDVRHRAIGTHRDAWRRLMLAPQIKHLADRASDRMIDAAGRPGGESNRGRSESHRDRRAACNGARHDRRGKAERLSKRHNRMPPCPPVSGAHASS